MADIDVYSGLTLIGSPAAGDRLPLGTGPGAGGYSLRGSFIWKNGAGILRGDASTEIEHSGTGNRSLTLSNTSWDRSLQIYAYAGGYRINAQDWTSSASRDLSFATGGTDRATITAAGNFGLGTTAPACRLHVKHPNEGLRLETTVVRGSGQNYIAFGDPSGTKGYVGYANANDGFDIQNNLSGPIRFLVSSVKRLDIDISGNVTPGADNAQTMGWPSARWTVVYAVTGTINTSDEREKTWRGGLTKAELKAATRIIAELGFYQWNDAVAEKGKDARYHFGARAQRVWQIMADEKLVAPITGKGKNQRPGKTPYAFLCWDEWDEETAPEMVDKVIPAKFEGKGKDRVEVEPERTERVASGKPLVTRKAGNRFGLRTDQFIMFLMAAQQAQIENQEARLAALEVA